MNNPVLASLLNFLEEIKKVPFPEQEAIWKKADYFLEEFGKKFPSSAIKVFCDLFGMLNKDINFDIRDKMVLEVGPGYSMGVAFLAALSGARKVYAVDAYPHPMGTENEYILAMLTQLLEERSFFFNEVKDLSDNDFMNHFAKHIVKDEKDVFSYRKEKIELLFPYYVEKLPFKENSFDLIYTSAAFEHFLRPRQAVQEMYRVTKSGGINLHSVDLRDHRKFQQPLDFLTLSDEQWLQVFADKNNSSYSHTNRLRHPEIIECFEKEGFRTLRVLPFMSCSVKDDVYQRFDQRFKKFSKEDLCITSCKYIFQKK